MYLQHCFPVRSARCKQSVGDAGTCYNREHSWPKSWWGGFDEGKGAETDLHALFVSDGHLNQRRSNLPLGEVGAASEEWPSGARQGTCHIGGGQCFEPPAASKGALARALLFVSVRYAGQWSCCATEAARPPTHPLTCSLARSPRTARTHSNASLPRSSTSPPEPYPPLRTNRTRRVLHPVLIGHAASLYCRAATRRRCWRARRQRSGAGTARAHRTGANARATTRWRGGRARATRLWTAQRSRRASLTSSRARCTCVGARARVGHSRVHAPGRARGGQAGPRGTAKAAAARE